MAVSGYPAVTPAQNPPADLIVQGLDIGTPELKELARLTGASGIVALHRATTQAFRLQSPIEAAPIAPFCFGAGFDCGLVPHEQTLERVRLVAMDMDSTLITIEPFEVLISTVRVSPAARAAGGLDGQLP